MQVFPRQDCAQVCSIVATIGRASVIEVSASEMSSPADRYESSMSLTPLEIDFLGDLAADASV